MQPSIYLTEVFNAIHQTERKYLQGIDLFQHLFVGDRWWIKIIL